MSRNGSKISNRIDDEQQKAISTALEKVFRAYNVAGSAEKDQRTHDFIFHMTDWRDDLARLSRLYENPSGYPQSEWNDAVFGFLAHAVGHLMAAAKLSEALCDPFKAAPALAKRMRQAKRVVKRKVA